MAKVVYFVCAIMSLGCTGLLANGYLRSHSRLILWTLISFGLLTIDTVDLVFFHDFLLHTSLWRGLPEAVSGAILLFGLIWELT